jgi:hypothetical protein
MKTCIDCNQTLPFSDFVPKATCKDGYEPRCRKCRSIKYNKSSPALVCKKIYHTQCTHSATRNHPLPAYTLSEFTDWVLAQPMFHTLYGAWQQAGYPKDLAPSVDRMDDLQPYSLTNIQVMSWAENRTKAAQSKANNELLVNHRAVTAYNQDGSVHKTYQSMAEAMREFGGKATQSWGISSVCNGTPVKDGKSRMYVPKTYKGFVWKWA